MVIQFLPTIVRIGQQVGPILLNEVVKPRFRKFLEGQVAELGQRAIREGKSRISGPLRSNRGSFIMRRGRQRFQCRKVK